MRYEFSRGNGDIEKVAKLLIGDEVGVVPCDTIYGLTARVGEENAEKLYEIKRRPQSKSFIHLMSLDDLKKSSLIVPKELYDIWPAPLTCILAAEDGLSTVAVRIPADDYIQALIVLTGPLFSTSVNFSGSPSLTGYEEIKKTFSPLVSFMVKADGTGSGLPSTLLDVTKKPWRVIRQGAYDVSSLI